MLLSLIFLFGGSSGLLEATPSRVIYYGVMGFVYQENVQGEMPPARSDQGTKTGDASVTPKEVETRPPEELIAVAKEAFRSREWGACTDALKSLIPKKNAEAMILTADALYARSEKRDRVDAQELYFRVIYELDDAPFKDHCYFRIGQIYLEQDNPFEAKLYFKQGSKKFPNSPYVPEARLALFRIAEHDRNLKELRTWAKQIEDLPGFEKVKKEVHYVSFIGAKRKVWNGEEVNRIFQANRLSILRFPGLLALYAQRLEQAGMLFEARNVRLDLINFHPDHEKKTASMLAVADYEMKANQVNAAVFLFRRILSDYAGTQDAARAMIQMANLIAQSKVLKFELDGREWTYSDLLMAIRFSGLTPEERAPFVYRQALLQAVSDPPDKALLTLRQLTHEYPEGPFAVLYRDSYRELLHHTVSNFYRRDRFWELDSLYQKHRYFLEHSTETQYPHMMAKTYLKMGLTAPARDVFEAMWREKESIQGFELAFEEPFVDYFSLLNDLRLDDYLATRLPEYEKDYGREGRFYDRFLVAQTGFELRQLQPQEVVAHAKTRPLFKNHETDIKRLQYLTLAAQAAEDWSYANELFNVALTWPQVDQVNPFLLRAAKMYNADYQYRIGNYFEARRRYLALRVDPALLPEERVWADLQLARLFEMKNDPVKSMELYAQVALNVIPGTEGYAEFAKRRMEAMAFDVQFDAAAEGANLGTN